MSFITALSIASVALSAASAMRAAQDRKNTANFNSKVQKNNAKVADVNAADVRARGEVAAQEQGVQTRQAVGTAKAALAGNNILVDDGKNTTATALIEDLTKAGAVDILRIRANAAREEYRALVQGSNFEAQAGLFKMQANSINPALAGFSAGVKGVSDNYDTLFK